MGFEGQRVNVIAKRLEQVMREPDFEGGRRLAPEKAAEPARAGPLRPGSNRPRAGSWPESRQEVKSLRSATGVGWGGEGAGPG